MTHTAGKDRVSCQAAGMKYRVDDIADELAGIAALEAHRDVDGSFNRPGIGDFEQDNTMRMW